MTPLMGNDPYLGSEALARGALDAGVQLVTGYPGSPTTATVDALLRLASPDVQIEWAINENSAFDTWNRPPLARHAGSCTKRLPCRNGSRCLSWCASLAP
jgi:TPP-dependent indolepyruvate ferredoxin oxidoreductase alpha subunit